MSSTRHKVINDISSTFLIGDIATILMLMAPPSLTLLLIDAICKRIGYNDVWENFLPFASVFWNLFLCFYLDIKIRIIFIPSWLMLSIMYFIGLFFNDGTRIKWTLVSFIYTIVGSLLLWLLLSLKKK